MCLISKSRRTHYRVLVEFIIVFISTILIIGIIAFACSCSLSPEERYVSDIIKLHIKGTTHPVVCGDILYIEDIYFAKYVIFTVSYNDFGVEALLTPMYVNGVLIGFYGGQPLSSNANANTALSFAEVENLLFLWDAFHDDMASECGFAVAKQIDGRKISRNIDCAYQDETINIFHRSSHIIEPERLKRS